MLRFCFTIIFIFTMNNSIFAQTFDCSKANNGDEQVICDDPALGKLEELMAAGYKYLRKERGKEFVKQLGPPLIKGRQACKSDAVCVKSWLENAILVYEIYGFNADQRTFTINEPSELSKNKELEDKVLLLSSKNTKLEQELEKTLAENNKLLRDIENLNSINTSLQSLPKHDEQTQPEKLTSRQPNVSKAEEDFLSIMGVTAYNKLAENIEIVSAKGYSCSPNMTFEHIDFDCTKEFTKEKVAKISFNKYQTNFEERWVSFNCHTFNGCNQSFIELGGKINSLFKVNLDPTKDWLGNTIYCDDDQKGTKICLENIFIKSPYENANYKLTIYPIEIDRRGKDFGFND